MGEGEDGICRYCQAQDGRENSMGQVREQMEGQERFDGLSLGGGGAGYCRLWLETSVYTTENRRWYMMQNSCCDSGSDLPRRLHRRTCRARVRYRASTDNRYDLLVYHRVLAPTVPSLSDGVIVLYSITYVRSEARKV